MGLLDWFKKGTAPEEETALVPSVGRMPHPAYRGSEPYLFVSYAHADSEKVFREIGRFNEAGFHVWYDEGIAPGNEWTDEIAHALEACSVFVVMITPTSAARENVQNEINFALDEKKPFIAIHLEETTLRGGLKLQIGTKQAILKYLMSEEEYIYRFTEAFERLGLKRKGTSPSITTPLAHAPQSATMPVQAPAPTPAPEDAGTQTKATAPSTAATYELTLEDRLLIERVKNSEVRMEDFEWIGSTIKAYHGIKRRVNIPSRATKIMSQAFHGRNPMEYVRLPESVRELDFAAFDRCSDLTQAVIENRHIKVNNVDDIGAFCGCQGLVVYCHRGSATYEELKRTHQGEIRFIEDMNAEATRA